MKIGVEYAMPGLARTFAAAGVTAVKHYPEAAAWGKMQAGPDAPIRFGVLDRFVREYQEAGFTDLMLCLRSLSPWASHRGRQDPTPRPEYLPQYERWVRAVVARYGGDGPEAMPGRRYRVRHFEVGSEFSGYEPEPVQNYLAQLEWAHRAAKAASPESIVLPAAFLTTGAFDPARPAASDEERFRRIAPRVSPHTLAEIRQILDRSDRFDGLNIHALGAPAEIEEMVAWLRRESAARRFVRPIYLSDTTPNLLSGWGPSTRSSGPPASLGILTPPVTERDRPELARFFTRLVDGDRRAEDAIRAFAAIDLAKKVVIAAQQGIAWINVGYLEDLWLFKTKPLQAGAGTAAWAGMVDARVDFRTEERTVRRHYPAFFALQQVAAHFQGCREVTRVPTPAPEIRLYRLSRDRGDCWIVWRKEAQFRPPDIFVPAVEAALPLRGAQWQVEPLAVRSEPPRRERVLGDGDAVRLAVSERPVFLIPVR